jgi:hypothetical protein
MATSVAPAVKVKGLCVRNLTCRDWLFAHPAPEIRWLFGLGTKCCYTNLTAAKGIVDVLGITHLFWLLSEYMKGYFA